MIDRYFLNILPALLLLIAMGLSTIKSPLIRNGVLITFLLFSWVDICFQKWHYKGIYKTQFREVSQYIANKEAKDKTAVVSKFGFYYSFYLDQEEIPVATRTLEKQIESINSSTNKPKSFWYASAHNSPYSLSPKQEEQLFENYEMTDSIELFDAWAKKYTLK